MKIIFFGSGEFGCETLRWLSGSSHQLLEIVTQPARPAGRGKKVQPTPIAQLAAQLQLPCRETPNINDPAFVGHITALNPNVLLVIAFGQKIGPEYLNMPSCRVINLHGSLLPQYRGAAPINRAIMDGQRQTGLTVIELNQVWDGGNILGSLAADILPLETAGELHDRLAALGPQLVADVLSQIEQGTDKPLPQDEDQATRAPKLQKTDAALDWTMPAETIRNRIHGLWPWPGAFCYWQPPGGELPLRLTIARAKIAPQYQSNPPATAGTLDEHLNIICGRDALKLLEVKPENSRLMKFEDFVNGRRLQPGDRFLNGG
jgi:methionyl-tRNA formyltransferase